MKVGLDVGSTTIKCVVTDDDGKILYQSYERHFSKITEKMTELLTKVKDEVVRGDKAALTVSGSAGMGISQTCHLPFVQEVYATRIAVGRLVPDADVIIELGGEDAKILFLTGGTEVRMNGSCAGGTGAFIDQMATLLNVPLDEMNELATQYEKIYTIASRCGVFAKSDVQPLLNQGARKTDISASIFAAVANQTIAGLAQGRPIKGKVLYLGGPLTFLSELRASFDRALKVTGICPENSLYFVAIGAAYLQCRRNRPRQGAGKHSEIRLNAETFSRFLRCSKTRRNTTNSATAMRSAKRRAATLKPTPATRFSAWTPVPRP